ncbi:40S ribosomal protein S26-B [Aspergillus niger]|uniref:Large ribosomal subunit protein P1 n=1 Tax=Aspergillus niger TaxID=5061 RepID=A0A505I0Z4_ASPNG|nr:40S ribosomal protein S26-B [Aspergillus niger]
MSTAELACSYAALILADDGIEVTADKLQTLLSAAKVPEVEPIWTSIFAKALEGKDIKELLTNKKEEEKEESDEDMGFGLFD